MAERETPVVQQPGEEGSSPRSTVLVGRMTTVVPKISSMKEGVNSSVETPNTTTSKVPQGAPQDTSTTTTPTTTSSKSKGVVPVVGEETTTTTTKELTDRTTPTTPLPHEYTTTSSSSYGAAYQQQQQQATPRQQSGGYYYHNPQIMTPEPNSPAPYDMVSGFLPGGAFVPTTTTSGSPFATPSLPRVGAGGSLSPLFPRPESGLRNSNNNNNGPPHLPYMASSPPLGGSNTTNSYPRVQSQSSEEGGWGGGGDNRNHHHHNYPLSPQQTPNMLPYGIGGRATSSDGRTYSFDEMPPLGLEEANPAYSPYNQNSPASPSVFLQPQQAWGYGPGSLPDPYGPPGSPLQPRPSVYGTAPYPNGSNAAGGQVMRGPLYGPSLSYHQFPASSPGPPIQTTASNKGPEGANLFIFHIPNHFTNLDMYQLFTPYGNLLSVRIMVEKDTGRSRGFGFVSYDSPASAAVAIKELNGFPIGNKRLKVQHKQIRRQDMHDAPQDTSYDNAVPTPFSQQQGPNNNNNNLPPSGSTTTTNATWYDTTQVVEPVVTENQEQSSALDNLEPLSSALPDLPGTTTCATTTEE